MSDYIACHRALLNLLTLTLGDLDSPRDLIPQIQQSVISLLCLYDVSWAQIVTSSIIL